MSVICGHFFHWSSAPPSLDKSSVWVFGQLFERPAYFGFRSCGDWKRRVGRGRPQGYLLVQQPQRLILDRHRRRGDVEARLPGPAGSIRFIVRVPSCLSRPRKPFSLLLHLNHDIAFPSPTLTKADGGAVCIRTCKADEDRTRCGFYRKHGLPVGSGVVESASKHIFGNRFEKADANALLAVRCCLKKYARARLPQLEGLPRRSRLTKNEIGCA